MNNALFRNSRFEALQKFVTELRKDFRKGFFVIMLLHLTLQIEFKERRENNITEYIKTR